jgi:hypothetical protein
MKGQGIMTIQARIRRNIVAKPVMRGEKTYWHCQQWHKQHIDSNLHGRTRPGKDNLLITTITRKRFSRKQFKWGGGGYINIKNFY